MKKTTFFIALILGFNLMSAQVYENTTVYDVPDGTNVSGGCGSATTAGQADSVVNVPLTGTIINPNEVTIGIQLSATWYGELVVVLIPPSGNQCALIRRIGATTGPGCGVSGKFSETNLINFNSDFTTPIPALTGTATVPAGNYAPTGGSDPFPMTLCNLETLLNGLSVEGNWTLRFLDHGVGDDNTINLFRITFGENALSIDNLDFNSKKLTVGSNPFNDTLDLYSSVNDVAFKIYTIDGKMIYEQSSRNESGLITLNTQNWKSGMYFITPIIEGQVKAPLKVIKR